MLVLFLVTACDSQQNPLNDQLVFDGSSINVPVPQRLRTIDAIDPAAVRAIATVNGVETELQLNAEGRFSGQIIVPAQSEFTVRIDFTEFFSGQLLTLARTEKPVVTGSGDTSVSLFSEDYDFSSFDFDGDAASNILERQFNTSPLDARQRPDLVQVEVFAEPPTELVAAGITDYQLVATLAGETIAIDASEGSFRHAFTVVRQDDLSVSINLVENSTGQNLTIGQQVRQVPVSQFNSQGSALVVFNGVSWNLDSDQDADGVSDANELIAGTDLLSPPASSGVMFEITFDVPTEITNTASVFAILEIDGQSTPLTRLNNTYTGSATAEAGASVSIDAEIRDTFGGTPLVLATFSGQATPVANGTLQLQDFSTQHDADNDGVLNHLELEQGTDPFNAILQCSPVTETIFANLTDDAFVQNLRLFDNDRLQVDSDRRITLIRFQYDDSAGEVIDARLNLTVGTDAGDGLITVVAAQDFEWNDQGGVLPAFPTGQPAGSAVNDWLQGVEYSFSLDPSVIFSDTTLIVQQSDEGNDVAFQSSDTIAPPTLELTLERCE